MSVGDLKNNLRKLLSELRTIKYEKDIDLDSISKGSAGAFLPIYHYIFLEYSLPVAEEITNKNFEMSGKTDLRFIETMYKVLRDVFAYKPSITKTQFFSSGFVERKIIMCTDIVQLVKARDRTLTGRAPTAKHKANSSAKLGPRSVGIPQPVTSKDQPVSKDKHSEEETEGRVPITGLSAPMSNRSLPFKVINEVNSHLVGNCHPLPTSKTDNGKLDSVRKDDQNNPSLHPVSGSVSSSVLGCSDSPIAIQAKVVREVREADLPQSHIQNVARQDSRSEATAVLASERNSSKSVSYNPACYGPVISGSQTQEQLGEEMNDKMKTSECLKTNEKLAGSNDVTQQLMQTLIGLAKSFTDLSGVVTSLQTRFDAIENLLVQQQVKEKDEVRPASITPEQIETLAARVTLLEIKLSSLDSQLQQKNLNSSKNINKHPAPSDSTSSRSSSPHRHDGHHQATLPRIQAPSLPFSPISHAKASASDSLICGNEENSLAELTFNSSSGIITKTAAELEANEDGSDHDRWSSTPTTLTDELQIYNQDDQTEAEATVKQADRILNMLKTTEAMLKRNIRTPVAQDEK